MRQETVIDANARRRARLVAFAAAAAFAVSPALAAGPGGSGPTGKSKAVTLEPVSGSSVKRVILTQKAAERLGIETTKVGEEALVYKQMVSGLVVPPVQKEAEPKFAPSARGTFGGYAKPAAPQPIMAKPASDEKAWVLVTLSPAEWERVAKEKPAKLLPLATREKLAKELAAVPSGMDPVEDVKRSMVNLYYVVPGKDHGLAVHDRMRVELELAEQTARQKVVPYGAVYYDAHGAPWVYVNTKPLTFERKRVRVDRIVDDVAVLSEGPDVGTPVVSVGAALLFGAEIYGK